MKRDRVAAADVKLGRMETLRRRAEADGALAGSGRHYISNPRIDSEPVISLIPSLFYHTIDCPVSKSNRKLSKMKIDITLPEHDVMGQQTDVHGLSKRGRELAEAGKMVEEFKSLLGSPWDPDSNPDGIGEFSR